ncbi:hypothetical protein [Spirosoma pulveris]
MANLHFYIVTMTGLRRTEPDVERPYRSFGYLQEGNLWAVMSIPTTIRRTGGL